MVGYLILTLAVTGAFVRIEQSRTDAVEKVNRINAAQCASLRNLYAVIRKTLEDGDMAIDKIAYYRTHPEEREAAHNRNQATIARFRDPPCPANVTIE